MKKVVLSYLLIPTYSDNPQLPTSIAGLSVIQMYVLWLFIIRTNKYRLPTPKLLVRVVDPNHDLVEAGAHQTAQVGEQPGHPEPGVSSREGLLWNVIRWIEMQYHLHLPAGGEGEEAGGEVPGGVDGGPGGETEAEVDRSQTQTDSQRHQAATI